MKLRCVMPTIDSLPAIVVRRSKIVAAHVLVLEAKPLPSLSAKWLRVRTLASATSPAPVVALFWASLCHCQAAERQEDKEGLEGCSHVESCRCVIPLNETK